MTAPTLRNILTSWRDMGCYNVADFCAALLAAGFDPDSTIKAAGSWLPSSPFESSRETILSVLKRAGDFARANQRINAIKELRALFGFGLKDAKDVVDAWCPATPYPDTRTNPHPNP